jgi:putative transposase
MSRRGRARGFKPACAMAGIDLRTLQRWQSADGLVNGDRRPQAVRAARCHALSEAERAQVLAVANEPRFAAVPPARIVPMLADEGVYLASESSFSRVLKAHGQTAHRGRAKAPKAATAADHAHRHRPTPGVVLGHDLFAGQVQGRWFHLYLILDLYSRKIVGWEVHDSDHADHAAHLVRRTALAEGIAALEPASPSAWRQRLDTQGDDGAGDAQLAGRQTLVLATPGQR